MFNKPKIAELIFVVESYNHMGNHSGTSAIVNYIENKTGHFEVWSVNNYKTKAKRFLTFLYRRKLQNKEFNLFGFSNLNHFLMARNLIRIIRKNKNTRIVLTEGENQFTQDFIKLSKEEQSRIFIITHQPMAWYKISVNGCEVFKNLGRVFVYAEKEKQYFAKSGLKNVTKIPHGVDYQFFKQSKIKRLKNHLLFVGGWLRDFRLLNEAFHKINNQIEGLVLHCVIPQKYRYDEHVYSLAKHHNVLMYQAISDEELLTLYQTSNVVLLPLLDVTANNVMGESIACRTPIVCNESDVCSWYKNEVWEGVFISKDTSDSFSDMIMHVLSLSEEELHRLKEPKMEKISWKLVLNELTKC